MSEEVSAFLASKKDDEQEADPEEEVKGDWKPIVELPEVQVSTGEENMDCIFKIRAKLYRWSDEQWKERGVGDCKLMRNRESSRVSLIMRQDQTKKVIANFIIEEDPLCQLLAHAGSDKAWVWMTHDFSEGESVRTRFAMRLTSPEEATRFKDAFNEAKTYNHNIRNGLEAKAAPVLTEEAPADPAS
mmetsp:Transcript_7928/g.15402  ORF Transcript_7928/g.15402 Transcript_7928/m.15402 type:complete len:187 (-) Transcript_7928:4048-4608(-)